MRLSSREWLLWRSAIKGSYWPLWQDLHNGHYEKTPVMTRPWKMSARITS
jgi:hypothetical protein